MNRQPGIVDRLIAYWTASGEDGENSDPLCRELSCELTGTIPRSLFAVIQAEPQRHREAIDEMVREQLGLATPTVFRDLGGLAPKPTPPPLPPSSVELAPKLTSPAPSPSNAYPETAGFQDVRRDPAAAPAAVQRNIEQSGVSNTAFSTGDVHGGISFMQPTPSGESKRPSSRPDDLPEPDSPIRILFLGANPADSTPLRLDQEVREIDRSLSSAALGHRFQLHQKWAVRASDLQSHLLRTKPQILHFSGHGAHQMGIVLEGEDGTSRPVAGAHLARLLGQFNQNLRCVVLNACYSEEQAQAIVQEVDCVVGMSTAVADRAAIRFAAKFYEALAYGQDVRAAFDLACSDIEINELGQDAVPHLLARRRAAETIRFAAPART
jgi:hypothetical protein